MNPNPVQSASAGAPLSLAAVRQLAAEYNLIPLVRTLLADLDTPVAAYLNRVRGARSPYSFLLESVEGGESLGRYSYLGAAPDRVLRQRRGRVAVATADARGRLGGWQPQPGALLDLARAEVARRRLPPTPELPPFLAGAVGYLGYDMVRQFETIPRRAKDDLGLDEALLMFFSRMVIFDHVRRQITIAACVDVEAAGGPGGPGLEAEYERACCDLEAVAARLRRAPRVPRAPVAPEAMSVFPNRERADFEAAVRRAQEYIAAGDVFQVVLSQRFDVATAVPPFQVYRALRVINPSPYMFYLQLGRTAVVGASPELLVRVERGRILYRPIAGTRPRGAGEAEDARLAGELLADEKERAEHIMLVDLGRNDVGRVAAVGSVTVPRLMFVEKYSHVQHLVSTVEGRLREGADPLDALAACFPAGTLTGAPKVRAMRIIEELEPTRRGVYGGAVLHFDYTGNLNACIAIRTAVFRPGMAHVQAGAGIVADSIPEREFQECVQKAGAVLRAIERAGAGLEASGPAPRRPGRAAPSPAS